MKYSTFSILFVAALAVAGIVAVGCGSNDAAPSCTTGSTLCGSLCVSTKTDNANCGACGTTCAAGQACAAGVCTAAPASCPSGSTLCGATCVSTASDQANCGTCGNACAAGQACLRGVCAANCAPGMTVCGTACTSTQTDNANCGGCGTKCAAGKLCSAGACATTCAAGYTTCGDTCANTKNDGSNCGGCGTKCAAGKVCSNGACTADCATGLTACGTSCTDTQKDPAHCGDCSNACPADEQCVAGSCQCGFTSVTAGRLQSCGVKADSTVACTGGFTNACDTRVADGGAPLCSGSQVMAAVPGFTNVASFDAGDTYGCALTKDGTVSCWGAAFNGRLGAGDPAVASLAPVKVLAAALPADGGAPTYLSGIAQLSVGTTHACALDGNADVWCWGSGRAGQLGTGTADSSVALKLTLPTGLSGITQIAAGEQHTCALAAGSVWCWGANNMGQLGSPGAPTNVPRQIPTFGTVSSLSTETFHTCAIVSTDSSVWCWGENRYGESGVNGGGNISTPTQVLYTPPSTGPADGGTDAASDAATDASDAGSGDAGGPVPFTAVQVSAGENETCARRADGSVWCWGHNHQGQLGSASPRNNGPFPTPSQVVTAAGTPLALAKSVTVGHNHACALVGNDNRPYCWGNNIKSQSGIAAGRSDVAAPVYRCGN